MTIASLLPEHDRTYPLTSRSSLTLTMESLATHQYLQQWSRWLQSASAPPWLFCAFSGSTAISEGDRRSATRRLVLGSLHLQAKRVQGIELVARRLRTRAVRILRDLDGFEQQLDLLRREVESPVDDLFHLDVAVHRALDHVVRVGDDLRSRWPEQLLGSGEGNAL